MNNHEAPDTNLIQKGVIVMKQRNEKYLKQDTCGIWHLNFRVPVRFGGKLIRQSLFTEDFNVAASIRDRFVVPILALNSGVAALEEIGKSITRATWEKLYPFLQPYLSDDYPAPVPSRPMRGSDFGKDAEAAPLKTQKFRAVPVLTFAQAAGFEPALEPLCDYLREASDRSQIFFDVPDTYFALEIQGNSMEPDYPHGSIALVAAGEFPERGDIVVAKLSTGQVVIKEYHRRNGVITLSSRNPEGQTFEWNIKEQPGFIQWMFPVVQVIISPRSQRHAKAQMPPLSAADEKK